MLSKSAPPVRPSEISSYELTQSAKTKIRRAVECSESYLGYFCTLTFSPGHLHPWHFSDDGTVRHDFAKYKVRKFLNTCRTHQSRLGRTLDYLWVAELQKNGNIHFHIMWNLFFDIKWLSKVWRQANNSVDIRRMNNAEHSANYIRKYITKADNEPIQGNRYFINHQLHEDMKPREKVVMTMTRQGHEESGGERLREIRETLQSLKEEIEASGGRVLDFGFHISRPRSRKKYRDKSTGEEKDTKPVDPRLSRRVVNILSGLTRGESLPF